MNQGIAFARTLRALDADDFRASKLGLLVAALLLVAWTWWMFAPRVPHYESTTNVRIESGHAIAYFPPDVLTRIHPGQPALIRDKAGTVFARVEATATDQVELALPANRQSRTAASVDIETSRVSPAAIVLRTLRGNQ